MNTEEGKSVLDSGQAISPSVPTIGETELSDVTVEIQNPDDSILAPGFHRLDRRHITAEIISGTIVSSMFTLAGVVGVVVGAFTIEFRLYWILLSVGISLFLLWLWFMTIFWPRREHRYASWKLDEIGLEIRRGVLWRHRITIPRARIQHVDISQGPLQRNFDLAELTIHTAGTQNASVKLEGLCHSVAIDLRDELISKRETVNVV